MSSAARAGGAAVPLLFASAVLVSAALLFAVQPMFARMVLPLMGGTPATWTTCLLFFQSVLVLGYLYVHLTSKWFRPRTQATLHGVLLLAALTAFPLAAPPDEGPLASAPATWLLATLASCVGLPFLALSATAPLLQRWYAGASGRDPYFLYAASNVGSLVGLLGYPLVVERVLTLAGQRAAWSGGFSAMTLLIAGCAALMWRDVGGATAAVADASPAAAPRAADRCWWLGLAFVPSSLLLGVTTHISTDVAAAPMLWVVPLALYLATFIAAFAPRRSAALGRWTARLAPLAIVAAVSALVIGTSWEIGLTVHLTAFAVVALAFHRALSDRRPAAAHLTQYFLVISVGGALGGILNAVVAPAVFTQVAEYPLTLALAALLRPPPAWRAGRAEPLALVLGLPVAVFTMLGVAWTAGVPAGTGGAANVIAFWLATAALLSATNRRLAFGLATTIAVLAHLAFPRSAAGHVIFAARSFFGVHRVVEDDAGTMHRLSHGTTLHGWQRLDTDRCEPTSYYHREGPIGQLFGEGRVGAADVAIIGLGAGGLVCYQPVGGRWTFLEIDPLVERIARDPALFTFLARAAGTVRVTIGDGRIGLRRLPPAALDTLVIDAFSSDAVPVHLLTREFVGLALERVRPGGHIVFHISNRHLDLGPVLAAAAASVGAGSLEQAYTASSADALGSQWMVVGRSGALDDLAGDWRWHAPRRAEPLWTDDFSNVLDVLTWRWRRASPAAR